MAYTQTNEVVDNAETGIDVSPTVVAGSADIIMIDDELMTVSAGTSTLTVARGAYGTVAAAHSNGADIFKVTHVIQRETDVLVYYEDSGGTISIKSISEPTAQTSYEIVFSGPAALTDSTTGVAADTLVVMRTDTTANLGADVTANIASLNAQINALQTAVEAATIGAV